MFSVTLCNHRDEDQRDQPGRFAFLKGYKAISKTVEVPASSEKNILKKVKEHYCDEPV